MRTALRDKRLARELHEAEQDPHLPGIGPTGVGTEQDGTEGEPDGTGIKRHRRFEPS